VLARKVDVDGNGVNDLLIVEWNGVRQYSISNQSPTYTFQAILQLNTGVNNGDIILNYVNTFANNTTYNYGAGATIGIKNSGTFDPVQVSLNPSGGTNFARPGNAIRFSTQNISPSTLVSPNTFGYRSQKSYFLAPGNNLDLTNNGTGVTVIMGTGNDDVTVPYDLGTNVFRFYGTNYSGTQMNVISNGLITFLTPIVAGNYYVNESLNST